MNNISFIFMGDIFLSHMFNKGCFSLLVSLLMEITCYKSQITVRINFLIQCLYNILHKIFMETKRHEALWSYFPQISRKYSLEWVTN